MTVATKIVDWAALGDVALISLGIGMLVTTTLAIAVRSALTASDKQANGESGAALLNRTVAVVSILVAASAFAMGIYEIAS